MTDFDFGRLVFVLRVQFVIMLKVTISSSSGRLVMSVIVVVAIDELWFVAVVVEPS